jgi:hypothetical protein
MFSAHNKNSHHRRQCRPQEEAMSRALTAALAAACLAFGPPAMAQFNMPGPGGFGSGGSAKTTTVKSSKSNTSDRMGGGGGGKGATGKTTTVKSSKSNTSDRMGGDGGKGSAAKTTVKSSKSNTSDRMGGGGGR